MPLRSQFSAGLALLPACALALLCSLAAACASRSSKKTVSLPPTPLSVETRVGVVRALGAGESFVLIETPSALAASALVEGQVLHCRPADAASRVATADIRVSRERHQSLVVANVMAGTPAMGAVVYSTPDPPPASTPVPDSVSSLSAAALPGLFGPAKP